MNLTDLTIEELEDLMRMHRDAAKVALEQKDFQTANVMNEEARKVQAEIEWRKKRDRNARKE